METKFFKSSQWAKIQPIDPTFRGVGRVKTQLWYIKVH